MVRSAEQIASFSPRFVWLDEDIPITTSFEPRHMAQIAEAPRPQNAAIAEFENVRNEEGAFVLLARIGGYQCLYVQFEIANGPLLDFLHRLACMRGFRAGACHHSTDTFWQGEESIDSFKFRGRPHELLPKAWDNNLEKWTIDTSKNPARRHQIPDMWLQAAWRMWFGEESFTHIPKEKLLSFGDAREITTLACGTVFIELFEDPLAFDEPENRRRQQAFLDHVDMKNVVERAWLSPDSENSSDRQE
jgi:hypothetical protein